MTILVGIKCRDGIVIGSDSSSTFTAGNFNTIEQHTKKIEILNNKKVIVAGTGQVGMGQRFCDQINQGFASGAFKNLNGIQIGTKMCELAKIDFTKTQALHGQYGALVAYNSKNDLHLCEFAISDFQPEQKTNNMWYASMGSGQIIADPFLGLMRQVYWQDGMPSLRDGIFITAWAIQHAIDVNSGGIGGDIQMSTLILDKGEPVARLLDKDELAEHRENVSGAMQYLRGYLNKSTSEDILTPPIPSPPTQ